MGRPNGAGAGAPRQLVKLQHSGVEVGFCTMRAWSPGGVLIESRPLTPLVPVARTREDAIQGRDADLEAAEAWLRDSLRR